MPKDDFKYDDMLKLWNEYAEMLLQQGSTLLHSAMTAEKPKLEDNTIIFEVPNQTLSAHFAEDNKLIQYIRENLNNYSIRFKTHITEVENLKMIFTSKEKYNFMLEKNSLLETFVTKLKLDLV
ncbi:MAG: hypothetical protein ABFR62_13710 [Bacteroidota bacterium]